MEKSDHSFSTVAEKIALFDQINSNSIQNKGNTELPLLPKYKIFENVKRLVHKNKSLVALPKDLLDLKIFSIYDICEIHIHKKGGLEYKVLSKSRNRELKEESLNDLKQFNHIFNQIKKSKNKLFDGNCFHGVTSFIIGTFLAKVFEFQQHNIIIILSNSGFLYPSKEEQCLFDHFFQNVQFIIESRINSHSFLHKYQTLAKTIQSIPLQFEILNEDSTLLFRSISNFQEEGKLSTHEIELNDNNLLVIYENNSEKWATDILHFQRVKLLGELLNTLKHELSNPLFGLRLSSFILSEEITEIEEKNLLKEITLNCQRCQNIIQDFQYLYNEKNENILIDLKKLIQEVFTLTKSETRLIKKECIFPDDQQLKITANPTFITQILFNLIINSAHSIEECNP
jgi:two-component system NtrC family sensor kinase